MEGSVSTTPTWTLAMFDSSWGKLSAEDAIIMKWRILIGHNHDWAKLDLKQQKLRDFVPANKSASLTGFLDFGINLRQIFPCFWDCVQNATKFLFSSFPVVGFLSTWNFELGKKIWILEEAEEKEQQQLSELFPAGRAFLVLSLARCPQSRGKPLNALSGDKRD